MKRILSMLLLLLSLVGCGAGEQSPPGTLVGISYGKRNGSVYGADVSLEMTQKEIVYARCMVNEEYASDYAQAEGVPIAQELWEKAETMVMAAYPNWTEARPSGLLDRFRKQTVLDGADRIYLTLSWDADGEIITVTYDRSADEYTMALVGWLDQVAADTVRAQGVQG